MVAAIGYRRAVWAESAHVVDGILLCGQMLTVDVGDSAIACAVIPALIGELGACPVRCMLPEEAGRVPNALQLRSDLWLRLWPREMGEVVS